MGKAVFAAPDQPGQYEVRYLRADSFTDVGATSNQINVGTVNRQYFSDALGSTEAITRKLWGGYNFQQGEYWTDAWGNSNAPSDSGNLYIGLGEHGYWCEPD